MHGAVQRLANPSALLLESDARRAQSFAIAGASPEGRGRWVVRPRNAVGECDRLRPAEYPPAAPNDREPTPDDPMGGGSVRHATVQHATMGCMRLVAPPSPTSVASDAVAVPALSAITRRRQTARGGGLRPESAKVGCARRLWRRLPNRPQAPPPAPPAGPSPR